MSEEAEPETNENTHLQSEWVHGGKHGSQAEEGDRREGNPCELHSSEPKF